MDIYPAICIPSTGLCRIEFASSLAKLIAVFVTNPVFKDGGTQKIQLQIIQSSSISTNREQLVMDCQELGCTHICFIDEDMTFAPSILHGMLRRKESVVVCNYRMRTKGGDFSAMGLDRINRIQTVKDSSGLEECLFSGFGMALIDIEVFRRIEQPWFPIHWLPALKRYTTEDKPFFDRVRQAGYKIYVDQDASKMIGHVGHFVYTWDDSGWCATCEARSVPDGVPFNDELPRL